MITGAQHALAVATTAAGISGGELTWRLSALAGLLIIAAFLAGAEISLVSVNRFRIRSLSDEGNRRAEKLDMLLEQPNRFLSTILMLTLLVQVGASAIATGLANSIGLPVAGAVATGMMTFLIFIFSEMAPKTYATNHTERVALAVTPIVNLLSTIFYPIVRVLILISNGVIRLFGGKTIKEGPFVTEGDIKALVSAAEEQDVIEEEEKKLIHSIFEFGDTLVREVMIPRTDMVMLDEEAGLEECLEIILSTGFSRIPVFRADFDHIVGVLYAKDLLPYLKRGESDVRPRDFLREAYFVPETKRVSELLTELRTLTIHMAIVLDEYGGTSGLVTIEDLLEEIVGEIFDEYDAALELYESLGDGRYSFDARISIDDLNELLCTELPAHEWDTLGGLMYNLMGKIPKQGEAVEFQGMRLTAQKVVGRRIYKVLLEVIDREECVGE
ncbi:MAG: hemolysin family protein [Actinomycetota bacterium]|nr:hemolysin family protein [Actinomycetota bacterium]MDD5665822.1 hemolysin family protein [Actinomycetota bacterium]